MLRWYSNSFFIFAKVTSWAKVTPFYGTSYIFQPVIFPALHMSTISSLSFPICPSPAIPNPTLHIYFRHMREDKHFLMSIGSVRKSFTADTAHPHHLPQSYPKEKNCPLIPVSLLPQSRHFSPQNPRSSFLFWSQS